MPLGRTNSATTDPSSSSGLKRTLPFKPPGPAKRAATDAAVSARSQSTASRAALLSPQLPSKRHAGSTALSFSRQQATAATTSITTGGKGKKAAQPFIESSSQDEDARDATITKTAAVATGIDGAEDEEEEDFGTMIDEDDIAGFSSPVEIVSAPVPRAQPPKTTATATSTIAKGKGKAPATATTTTTTSKASAIPAPAPKSKPKPKPKARRPPDPRFLSDTDSDLDVAAAASLSPPPAVAPTTRNTTTNRDQDDNDDGEAAAAEALDLADASIPRVPAPLLTRLMHEHMRDKSMKISKVANEVMRGYIDVFVREAVARAVEGKKEEEEQESAKTGNGRRREVEKKEVWLDVGDLERIVPGMVLDF